MTKNKIKISIIYLFFILFLTNCFEYEEKIFLSPNLSGKVSLEYIIPINKSTENSLIGFLPSTKESFEERYNVKTILFEQEKIKPLIANLEYRKIKVEFFYNNILELQDKIYGITDIVKFGNTIIIKRTFKNVQFKKLDNRVFNFFYDFIYQKFKDRILKFTIYVPSHFDIISNAGNLPLPGVLFFQFPLERTFELNKDWIWTITIKINPVP
ncbi:MAG: hypothetical protein KatS3mg129_1877 [Leptospiraceae bacterium]|nr:MAG: hypothetical protein KatS3mg129_1877 [Leptospiraceae bacterium]